jgi:carbamoyltransferase
MNVIGINIGHDSGVTLISNKKVLFASNEERYSREKMHVGFPELALRDLLSNFKLPIDVVAVEGKAILPLRNSAQSKNSGDKLRFDRLQSNVWDSVGLTRSLIGTNTGVIMIQKAAKILQAKRRKDLGRQIASIIGTDSRIVFVDHHEAHIASSTLASPILKNGLALSFDASGEGFCSKVAKYSNNTLTFQNNFSVPSYFSPANLYKNITSLLGFRPLRHEGKITGLAAFGDSSVTAEYFNKKIGFDNDRKRFFNKIGYDSITENMSWLLEEFSKEDIAAGLQSSVENTVTNYVSFLIEEIGDKSEGNLFLSGGLFANVKLNQKILELKGIKDVFVAPNMGDGGLSLGAAAMFVPDFSAPANMYLGTDVAKTKTLVRPDSSKYDVCEIEEIEIASRIANLLVEKKIVAIARGRMEFGPRALCNRSILYSAQDKSVNTWLNIKLKRTEFMPFAPVVRDIDLEKFFAVDSFSASYEYMTLTTPCKDITAQVAPAIVHVDNTARPQIVKRNSNPLMYEILSEYEKLTNNGILVNTSFNMHEEPIVRTSDEAIQSFIASDLDVLLLNNTLYSKKSSSVKK